MINWARGRSLGSSSCGGISVALALCAAGWFTAGTRTDNVRAVAALCAAYLAMAAGRSLAGTPGLNQRSARGTVRPSGSALARTRWLAVLGWGLSECACYAGLAAGAAADRWSGVWMLALAVVGLMAVRDITTACTRPDRNPQRQAGTLGGAIGLFFSMPAGGRVLLIAIVAPGWGGRATLFALLDWAIIAVGYGLAGPVIAALEAPAPVAVRRDPAPAPWPGSLVVLLGSGRQDPTDPDSDVGPDELAGTGADPPAAEDIVSGDIPWVPSDDAGLRDGTEAVNLAASDHADGAGQMPDMAAAGQASGRDGADAVAVSSAAAALLVRLRDDGALARRLGRPVRGNLLPLPPAVLGLLATATLALLGVRDLPPILILAPVLIMLLLAAAGSSNRHAGRFDWLVPAVLLGWQFLYLAAVSIAVAVPGPAAFALAAALALRFADLTFRGRPVMMARPIRLDGPARERGTVLGWEGRMLLLGIGAAVGIATFAYLVLTAYLGVLLGAKVLTSCLGSGRETAGDRLGDGRRRRPPIAP